jgi:N-acetyl sugar amidotransferase
MWPKGRVCKFGIWDESVPNIKFDEVGASNYYHLQKKMMSDYPRGEIGNTSWKKILHDINTSRGNNTHDCIIGVSGGVDSSYLLFLAKQCGLNPLAVHLDNGFNSEIAVSNIKKITTSLNIDLVTYVINYEEVKSVLKSYMRACMPWIDFPTDIAIKSIMYDAALKYNVKFILRGNDFRSEGKQPTEWTYSDSKQLLYLNKKFGTIKKLNTFPLLKINKLFYSGFIKKIKDIRPFYFLQYNKIEAKKLLIEKFNWVDYGGHHHENLFTKFAMSYWLPLKFGIDKRVINLSAQIISGEINRQVAIESINKVFDSEVDLEELKNFVLKKLDLSHDEFQSILKLPNKSFRDYPSSYNLIYKNANYFKWVINRIYSFKPMSIDSNTLIDKS